MSIVNLKLSQLGVFSLNVRLCLCCINPQVNFFLNASFQIKKKMLYHTKKCQRCQCESNINLFIWKAKLNYVYSLFKLIFIAQLIFGTIYVFLNILTIFQFVNVYLFNKHNYYLDTLAWWYEENHNSTACFYTLYINICTWYN